MTAKKYVLLFSFSSGILLVILISLFLQSSAVLAQAPADATQVIQAGLSYLQRQQQADGGIVGFSGVSDPDTTARVVLAFALAGEPVSEVITGTGSSMPDYLATQAITFTHDITGTLLPGRAGLLLSAAAGAGDDPSNFGGMDLVAALEASYQPDTGTYSTTAKQDFSSGQASDSNQAWAILGLSLAGKSVPEAASQYLVNSQAENGSWGFDDPDTTALAVTALLSSQRLKATEAPIQKAIEYFITTQAPSGGWKPSWDTDSLNADSTGWILQALVSAGEDPTSQTWTVEQGNPVQALLSLHKPDGSIGGTYANTYSTAEAIIGLAGTALSEIGMHPVSHQAGLAIFTGDGRVYTDCVSFSESEITGLDLLQRTGMKIETAINPNQGTAVCKIGEVGDPSGDCFGSMPDYWSYWQQGDSGWEYSVKGADLSQVKDGEVNAWSWGTGDAPPAITFQNICEGVAFVMPTTTQTSLPTPKAITSPNGAGTYIVYASILVVLVALVIYLVRKRSK